VHYSGFDTDLSTPASVDDLFSEKYHMSTP
jgi:hypothetical protein